MARNPFEFLDSATPERRERTLLHLLMAIVRKGGGELELTLEDVTAVSDGDSLWKYPADTTTRLVLRYARKGAEAYFLADAESSETKRTFPPRAHTMPAPQPGASQPLPPPIAARHAVHDDLDYALKEEEMATRMAAAARLRNQQARAESGAMPWRSVKPQ